MAYQQQLFDLGVFHATGRTQSREETRREFRRDWRDWEREERERKAREAREAEEASRRAREWAERCEREDRERREFRERAERAEREARERWQQQEREQARTRANSWQSPWDVLGVPMGSDHATVRKVWIAQMKANHPDVGGDVKRAQAMNAAYQALRKQHGWK